jgi:hypothetical protein
MKPAKFITVLWCGLLALGSAKAQNKSTDLVQPYKNRLIMGWSLASQSTGMGRSVSLYQGYQHRFNRFWGINSQITLAYGSSKSSLLYNTRINDSLPANTIVDINLTYPIWGPDYTAYYIGLTDGNTLKTLKPKPDKSLMATADFGGTFHILPPQKRHNLNFLAGLTLGYIDRSFYVESRPGIFYDKFTGKEFDIQLVVPYHSNFLTWGTFYQFDYAYHFDKISVGSRFGAHFMWSSERLYTLLGINLGYRF